MARLGRGRREGARIRRNVSTPTATPLVRNRVKQTPNGARRAWLVERLWRRKRAHIVLRSPSTPPVIRKRIVQTPVANDRAHVVARAWRRKRAHIVMRAPLPAAPVARQKQPLVSRTGHQASAHVRGFQPRGARISRNVSTPTVTPLVKPVVVLGRNRGKAARVRAFFVRHPVQVVRPPIIAAVPFVRHPQVITSATSRAVRVRAHMRRRPRILRNPAPAAVQVRVVQPLVVHSSRAAQVRAHTRHRARILRNPVVAPVAVRQRQPIVTHTRAAVKVRYTRPRNTLLLRSNVYVTQTKTVPRLVLGRNNRKAALVRSYYARHRSHLETSTLGTNAPPVTIVTTFFGPPNPADAGLGGSLAENMLGGVLDERELVGAVASNTFGQPNPRRS